jgi:DNA-binding transcriptional ArsR family regulator
MANADAQNGNGFSDEILSLLRKHVYGLSIEDVSRFLDISRITASKYLAILEASGKIVVREVGNTKLHYLSGNYREVRA